MAALPDSTLRQLLFPSQYFQPGLSALASRLSDLHCVSNTEPRVYRLGSVSCKHSLRSPRQTEQSTSCPVATALLLSWSDELQMFVDTVQGTVLLPHALHQLLEKASKGTQHSDTLLLEHLLDAYPLNMDETIDELRERMNTTTVKGPINHLAKPVCYTLCMICQKWVAHLGGHRHRVHPGASKASLAQAQSGLFIRLLRPGGGGSLQNQRSIKVRVSTSQSQQKKWSQPSLHQPKQQRPPPLIPTYPKSLGWQLYLASCGEDPASVLLLRSLAMKQPPWHPLSESGLDAVEQFLEFLPKALQTYLHQADQRLKSSHSSVRELVTYG
jgi:hypothetical protein